MKFELIESGWVYKAATDKDLIGVGPRIVKRADGSLLCSFMTQTKISSANFVPVLSESNDNGKTWSAPKPVWPELVDKTAAFVSLSKAPDGRLMLGGMMFDQQAAGDTFWNEETQGLFQNEMIWAESLDEGTTWSSPNVIPMPIPGSAEAPSPVSFSPTGRMFEVYSPYPTYDPNEKVDENQVVLLFSDDNGKTWDYREMLRFAEKRSHGAEAWCQPLADGTLLGTTWHVNSDPKGEEYSNKYAISRDDGNTWSPTNCTGIHAHTTTVLPLPTGGALVGTVRRRSDIPVGIYLSVVHPTEESFNIKHDQLVFKIDRPTIDGTDPNHDNWPTFNFGEPAFIFEDEQTLLAVFWQVGENVTGIRSFRLRIV